ncbi:MAG TPA: nuclear transport factor 2 family protein [Candidatus Dormibacteraeota bacterium]|nr:nuclear transport factor 2 family protein [Candidatus Dormibacteraeota bacterium]
MKNIIHIAILTVALLSFGRQQSAAQGADSAAEQEVTQTIKKYRTALLQKDAATLKQIWADDYTFTNGAGEMLSKAQRLAHLESGATSLDSISEEKDMKVRIHGNVAVATNRVTIKGQYSGKQASGQYRSLHVWVKGATGWQLVANQLTPVAAK